MEHDGPKMNVLLVNDHLGWNGTVMHGVGRLFLEWIPIYDDRKYRVILCILREKDALGEYFEQQGIKIRFFEKGKFNPLTLLSFIKIIRAEKIDVMHVQGYGATTFGRLARVLTGIPILVHFQDTSRYYPWVQRVADLILARFTDAAIAVSNSVKRFCIESGRAWGIDPHKMIVLPNCVSLKEFRISDPAEILTEKNHLGIDPASKIVGTVTRLYDSKGNRYLLEAAAEVLKIFPNTIFLIVGDGPLRQDLQELSRQLGIEDRVIFTGFCNNVAKLLGTFDIKVFTSWEAEGSPLALLEAMAMGKAIVATNIIDIIEDGVTGLLVPPKDPGAIARQVISLLTDEDLAARLGANARMESRKYSVDVYVRKLEGIYDDLILKSKEKDQQKSSRSAQIDSRIQ
jgi:glycosyltransferase involved in cell wall biosynthesis